MSKLFKPTYYQRNLFDVMPKDLLNKGIKTIFCDLDNTIVPYSMDLPTNNAIKFVNTLKEANISFYIVSNNNYNRVSLFCKSLGVKYLHSAQKPLTKRINKFIKDEGLNKSEILLVGDQILTDVLTANQLGVKSLLVEPASSGDLLKTKLNRMIDKRIRSSLRKKNQLKSIKED